MARFRFPFSPPVARALTVADLPSRPFTVFDQVTLFLRVGGFCTSPKLRSPPLRSRLRHTHSPAILSIMAIFGVPLLGRGYGPYLILFDIYFFFWSSPDSDVPFPRSKPGLTIGLEPALSSRKEFSVLVTAPSSIRQMPQAPQIFHLRPPYLA